MTCILRSDSADVVRVNCQRMGSGHACQKLRGLRWSQTEGRPRENAMDISSESHALAFTALNEATSLKSVAQKRTRFGSTAQRTCSTREAAQMPMKSSLP